MLQGSNCQAAVDRDYQMIVAMGVSNQPPDVEHLVLMLEWTIANTSQVPKTLIADAGYWSEDNAKAREDRGVDLDKLLELPFYPFGQLTTACACPLAAWNYRNAASVLPVVDDENRMLGLLRLHDLVRAGLANAPAKQGTTDDSPAMAEAATLPSELEASAKTSRGDQSCGARCGRRDHGWRALVWTAWGAEQAV